MPGLSKDIWQSYTTAIFTPAITLETSTLIKHLALKKYKLAYKSRMFAYIWMYKQYYPSSNQFRDPPTYTHQPSMQQKVPFSLISCSSSKVAFCSCVEWGWHIYNIVESESDPLTRRAVDLFEKEPLKGNSEVHLHTPTKFGEDRSKDLGGDREQTDRQTNRQTDKRCSIYSMMHTNYKVYIKHWHMLKVEIFLKRHLFLWL